MDKPVTHDEMYTQMQHAESQFKLVLKHLTAAQDLINELLVRITKLENGQSANTEEMRVMETQVNSIDKVLGRVLESRGIPKEEETE